MSQHQQVSPLNANLVALILIVTFVISGGLILANSSLGAPQADSGESVEVALAESTETSSPSSTIVTPPPTATPFPTPTSIPVIAPTEPPALSITGTPQIAADAGVSGGNNAAVSYDPALVSQGAELFLACSACHGPDARGLPKLGKDLVDSEFVRSLNDEDLLTFVKTGRPSWDALNTTGIDMPPKGGNPVLTDEDILAIIAYMRTLSAGGG